MWKSKWRDIEVVITGLTRNQFERKLTGVRISLPPPIKASKLAGLLAFFISQSHLFYWFLRNFFHLLHENCPRIARKPQTARNFGLFGLWVFLRSCKRRVLYPRHCSRRRYRLRITISGIFDYSKILCIKVNFRKYL